MSKESESFKQKRWNEEIKKEVLEEMYNGVYIPTKQKEAVWWKIISEKAIDLAIQKTTERIIEKISKLVPKEKPDLCHDGTEGMFSAQNDGIEYGEWELGQKILERLGIKR